MPRDSVTAAIGHTPRDAVTIADDTPAGSAMASLANVDRRTSAVVRRYEDARAAFLAAAAELGHHGERFDTWAGKLGDAGGRHAFTRPPEPAPVTRKEIAETPVN